MAWHTEVLAQQHEGGAGFQGRLPTKQSRISVRYDTLAGSLAQHRPLNLARGA